MRKSLLKLCLLILIVFSFSAVMIAPAVGAGNGDGTGGGGGAAVPLVMDWCYPANGETNVSTTVVIQCKYSHNVAQSTVSSRNIKMFTLTKKADGAKVEVQVYTADSQIEFDKRQYIYIRPIEPLENNTTYVLSAKAGVQAKNGMVTANDQSFQFTTCASYGNFNDSSVASMITTEEAGALGSVVTTASGSNPTDGSVTSQTGNSDNANKTSDETAKSAKDSSQNASASEAAVKVNSEKHQQKSNSDNYLLWLLLTISALLLLSVFIKILLLKRSSKI